MKKYLNNIGYFLKESKTIFQIHWLSNLLSILSMALIFFILASILCSWWISNQFIEAIKAESEISVYFDEKASIEEINGLMEEIKGLDGVSAAILIGEEEAYKRMVDILGKEARVLEFFDENPFSPFIEVKIDLDQMDPVLERLESMPHMDYIRDNREVLDRIHHIAGTLKIVGYLAMAAAGITTVVIISHIIRMGIMNNQEEITTLKLLGAPGIFVGFPYLLEGLLLTVGGGILALVFLVFILEYLYGQVLGPIPFIPLPSKEILLQNLTLVLISLSILLGVVGSLIGLSSAKSE